MTSITVDGGVTSYVCVCVCVHVCVSLCVACKERTQWQAENDDKYEPEAGMRHRLLQPATDTR